MSFPGVEFPMSSKQRQSDIPNRTAFFSIYPEYLGTLYELRLIFSISIKLIFITKSHFSSGILQKKLKKDNVY